MSRAPARHTHTHTRTHSCTLLSSLHSLPPTHCTLRYVLVLAQVVWFTATFPYAVLVLLLVRGLQLEGSGDGVLYYVRPNLKRLAEPQVCSAS